MKKIGFWLILLSICGLGLLLRLYKINSPIADWHSWRQADTAAVARNFVKFGFDPLRPRYDDLSNIQSGKDNPNGYRMVEFPIYQAVAFGLYSILPSISIELSLRIISIFSSLMSIILIAIIGARTTSKLAGLCAACIYAILPYSVFYGRSILPETFMVGMSLMALCLAVVSIENHGFRKYIVLVLSSIFASIAILVKPVAVFLLVPMPYLFFKSLGISVRFLLLSGIGLVIALIPIYLWRQWITQFPEGIPVYTWLLNDGNIRFKGAWFYWIFAERISSIILGYWGVALLVLGIIRKSTKSLGFMMLYMFMGALLYVVIIARGNVQHDYYQIPLIPVIALYVGLGMEMLIHSSKIFSRVTSFLGLVVCIVFSVMFSWYTIRGFYWINHQEIVDAGLAADKILPLNAKVIAPYNGDTSFLYQTNRQGWPLGFEIDKKIQMGATHYVTVSPTDADGETKDLANRYTVLERNDRYAIIDLTQKK